LTLRLALINIIRRTVVRDGRHQADRKGESGCVLAGLPWAGGADTANG